MIVAHRGASKDAPENTIPAFELAWEQGADAIEGDFRITKDGTIVCIHDGNTERVSGVNLVVCNVTLAELRALDVGVNHGNAYKGTAIPTIADVFATIPDNKKIYIEIKCGEEIIPPLFKEIEKSGLKNEQIVVICFDKNILQAIKAQAPWVKGLWLSDLRRDESGKISPSLAVILQTLNQIKADGLSASQNEITEPFVQQVMENGFEFHVWTVDDGKAARRFHEWGVKSITTNVPDIIRRNTVDVASHAGARL